MESLNLNMLVNSLPPSNLANAEKDLANNFKAAALSLTTFYRSSRRTSKRAYNAGYAAACQDMLLMIQQGVSAGDSGQDTTIGRIMDYIEARLEAIKSREEEEDEDEEKDREKERTRPSASTSVAPSATMAPSKAAGRPTDAVPPPTPHTPSLATVSVVPSSPSPQTLPLPLQRSSRTRVFALSNPKEASIFSTGPAGSRLFDTPNTPYDAPVAIIPAHNMPLAPAITMPDTAGMKRRHNVMMLDSAIAPPSAAAPIVTDVTGPTVGMSRRRTRSSRGGALGSAQAHYMQDQNRNVSSPDAMDIEEEGRERKRVARR